MAALPPRSRIGVGLALCLIAVAGGPAAAHEMKLRNAQVEPLAFAAMDGWNDDDHAAAFEAFLKSCSAILQGSKAMRAARPVYGALYNACENAATLAADGTVDRAQARKFFEDNFKPVRILPAVHTYGDYTGADGFYTGYYEAEVAGSRVKTDELQRPALPGAGKTRGQEEQGVLAIRPHRNRATARSPARDWRSAGSKDPVDAFFAQIQGSTRVKLDDGELLRLNYIASNGKPYTPVGRLPDRPGHLHARRNVDGQDPRIHGSQSGRGQGAAREEPLLRVLLRDAARSDGRMRRRAGHPADAVALDCGRSLDPRLRHADLDRRQISDHQRPAAGHLPASDVRAGYRLRHSRGGARRYLFRPRRGYPPHRRPHQAVRQIRHAGAARVRR